MKTHLIACVFLLSSMAPLALAQTRTSANYAITTEVIDIGGRLASSANYANDGSLGGITGVSTVATPAETAKHGYIGQLTEVTALQLAASPLTVNETATRQLSAMQLLDDLTINAVPASSITWSIVSGPLTSISTSGLAASATVYQDTAATAQGDYAGLAGILGLTVLDSIPDNFGSYANDGLGDDWQVQYFGQPPNAKAGPLLDPDFDGLTNLAEFAFGLLPLSGGSAQVPAAQKIGSDFVISFPTPAGVIGITYGAEWSTTMNPLDWHTIPNTGVPPQHTFSVPIGANTRMFTRLRVTSP